MVVNKCKWQPYLHYILGELFLSFSNLRLQIIIIIVNTYSVVEHWP